MKRINPDYTIKHLTIHDSGDPSVGISPTHYELSGGFVFDSHEQLALFKEYFLELFLGFGFIHGRGIVTTDVEERAQLEAEKTQDFSI